MPAHTLPIDYKAKFAEDYLNQKPKFMEEHVRTMDKYPEAFAEGFMAYIDNDQYCPYEKDTPEANAFVDGVKCARRNVVDLSLPVSPLR